MSRRKNKEKRRSKNNVEKEIVIDGFKQRPNIQIDLLNKRQENYYYSLVSAPATVCEGPAGVGKTYLAASVAAKDFAERRIRRIVLSRANVGTGKSLGAFPGTVEEKMAPWLLPITNVLKSKLGIGLYEHACKTGGIQIQPIETIRGQSFDDAIVIVDEAQQLDEQELKAITTRIGRNCRLFLMGDAAQRDTKVDGLEWLRNLVGTYNLPIDFHKFTSDDCVRSDLCTSLIIAFEKEALAKKAKAEHQTSP